MSRIILFVGPLPPPVNGLANVCASMLAIFQKKLQVRVFDRAPCSKGIGQTSLLQVSKIVRYLVACVKSRNVTLYLALSGGLGQLIDGIYLLLSKIFISRIIVHHHSFRYLNSPTWINGVIFFLTRHDTHIVLSQGMRLKLANVYGIDLRRVRVISNAAMYKIPEWERVSFNLDGPIRVGFISNITFDKGFVEFFGVLERLRRNGTAYQACIAGPVDAAARLTFDSLLAAASNCVYTGPLYSEAKLRFYEELDVLLFPTKYANEAEPLVIHEALRCGVYVIANSRGATAEMLANGGGSVLTDEKFMDGAAIDIQRFAIDRELLVSAQRASFRRACSMHVSATDQLTEMVEHMTDSDK